MSLSETDVQDKIATFRQAEEILKEFMSENEEWVDVFFSLVEARNAALSEADFALRQLDTSSGRFKLGSFSKSQPAQKTKYAVTKIPTPVLMRHPGLIKTLDSKHLNKLLKSGELEASEIEEALEEYTTKPTVRSPGYFDVGLVRERNARERTPSQG